MDKVPVICIVTLACALSLCMLLPLIYPHDLQRSNEKDVVEHLGISIVESSQVPQGQTVRFQLKEFKTFLQFIAIYKPNTIYDVSAKLSILPLAQGEYLYFISSGIIYVYG